MKLLFSSWTLLHGLCSAGRRLLTNKRVVPDGETSCRGPTEQIQLNICPRFIPAQKQMDSFRPEKDLLGFRVHPWQVACRRWKLQFQSPGLIFSHPFLRRQLEGTAPFAAFSEAEVAVWAEPGSACYFHGLWSHSTWMQKSFNGFMRNVFTDESKPKQFNKTLGRGREALYHTQRL